MSTCSISLTQCSFCHMPTKLNISKAEVALVWNTFATEYPKACLMMNLADTSTMPQACRPQCLRCRGQDGRQAPCPVMSMADVCGILQGELCGLGEWDTPEVPKNIEIFSREQVYAKKRWLEEQWRKLCTYWHVPWWEKWVEQRAVKELEGPHLSFSDVPSVPGYQLALQGANDATTEATRPSVPQPMPYVADVRVKKLQEEITYREMLLVKHGDYYGGRRLQQELLEKARSALAKLLGPATVILSLTQSTSPPGRRPEPHAPSS